MASAILRKLRDEVSKSDIGGCVVPSEPYWERSAVILRKWEALESLNMVRLDCEWDEDYSPSEFGEPRDMEAYGVIGRYRVDFANGFNSDRIPWESADSVWGCAGYRDVLDWRENAYILDIMETTIDAFRDTWKAHVRRQREIKAGACPTCHGTGRVA